MIIIVIIFLLLFAAETVQAQSIEEGRELFELDCSACHTIGEGDLMGPDLLGITEKRERDWLIRYTYEPDVMLAEGDPIARQLRREWPDMEMPNLGLIRSQAESIILYLEMVDERDVIDEPEEIVEEVAPGDPESGKKLFSGEKRFENRASSCMACHAVAGLPAAGGGTLGPDLTKTYSKFGRERLSSVLRTMPFPMKQPIYRAKPLTEEEKSHLIAFFQEVDDKEPFPVARADVMVRGFTVGGAIVLILLFHFIWRKRSTGVRKHLVNKV